MDVDEAVEMCDKILEDLDLLPERAAEFSDSVAEKVGGMRDWNEEHQAVTDRMSTALENIRGGVDKWLGNA